MADKLATVFSRACTGFDGDFEVAEAIGGGDHLKTPN